MTATGQSYVRAELTRLLDALPPTHKLFGPASPDGRLQLPRHQDRDQRTASWPKKLASIASQVCNQPASIDDCWFVPASKEDGYHEVKLSATGSTGKYRTARLLRVFVDPASYDVVAGRDQELHAIHRCGKGRASGKDQPCCINPYHIYFGSCADNQDTKGCKYGARWLCPHRVKCVFTWHDTGLIKPCLQCNSYISLATCDHVPSCSHV